ncbi:MAG: winged helix-turn-helix transcriptional regulator [Candidatus Lokiarchaeota archaeon]|nr:winged helix-turn-helix transcriptional regulator [Candidatus Lokiarchaeota archaeon]
MKEQRDRVQEFLDEFEPGCLKARYVQTRRASLQAVRNDKEFKGDLAYHSALSNDIRLLIYKMLANESLCTCALAQIFEMTEGSVSHHLKKLEQAGLIIGQKRGRYTIYSTKVNFLKKMEQGAKAERTKNK